MTTKALLRKEFLRRRWEITKNQYSESSLLFCEHFFKVVNISALKWVHIFLPILNKREPNTWLIIDRIRREFSHIQILIPRIKDFYSLDNVVFEGLHQLRMNEWNIYEPLFGELVDAKKIDLVIVPTLACDEQGNRIGYGKGFYDRLLGSCRRECKKVGFSYFDPVKTISDLKEHDIPLDLIITPNRVLHFN